MCKRTTCAGSFPFQIHEDFLFPCCRFPFCARIEQKDKRRGPEKGEESMSDCKIGGPFLLQRGAGTVVAPLKTRGERVKTASRRHRPGTTLKWNHAFRCTQSTEPNAIQVSRSMGRPMLQVERAIGSPSGLELKEEIVNSVFYEARARPSNKNATTCRRNGARGVQVRAARG